MNLRTMKFKLVRCIIHFFLRNFKIRNNRILFSSFKGKQISCNPKAIYEYLLANGRIDYDMIWVNNGLKHTSYPVKTIKYNSFLYFYYYFTSKWIITNSGFSQNLRKPTGQFRIETWHGGGAYKKTFTNISKSKKYIETIVGNDIDYYISSCTKFSDVMADSRFIDRNKFIEIGMPRNDVFFNKNLIQKAKNKVIEFYEINNRKIILYAPTWRDDGTILDINLIFSVVNALNLHYNEKYILLCRAHHGGKLSGFNDEIYDATNYTDMQELLCAADILITDYSSCMWDFSLMYKPCFIFATDIDKYKKDRDFYTPMSEWPFPIATNADELVNNIINFDSKKYLKDVKIHHDNLGICEDGHACEKVCKIIEDVCIGR